MEKCLRTSQGIYIPIAGKFYSCGALCQRCFPHKGTNTGWKVNVRVLESSPDLGPDYIGIRYAAGEKLWLDMGMNYAVPDDVLLLNEPVYDPPQA